ncbi:unnamed protein product, partial [marine sediment metagenome]
ADGLTEQAAVVRVWEECPDWTPHRIRRYFAAAGLFGYTADLTMGVVQVYQNGTRVLDASL